MDDWGSLSKYPLSNCVITGALVNTKVVNLFGVQLSSERENVSSKIEPANHNEDNVIKLVTNKKIAKGVPATPIYRQLEALLIANGVDMLEDKTASDFKVVSFLLQGMLDRTSGIISDRCILLDTLRLALAYEVPSDTEELFGELLGRLDREA
jgi:hypothetical protein